MEEKVWEVLEEVNEDILDYGGENMIEDGVIQSFDIVAIIVGLEEKFQIRITPEWIKPENFASKNAIVAMVRKQLGQEI